MYDLEKFLVILENDISQKRYKHCIRTAIQAEILAKRYDVDPEKAYVAGLLHDCAKGLEQDYLRGNIKEIDLKLDRETLEIPNIIHSKLGCEFAKKKYNIKDEEILNAIRFHTTGRECMTDLEKVVYLADMIEPKREYTEVEEIREIAQKDLDKACLKAIDMSLMHLIDNGELIHSDTIKARNYLIKLVEGLIIGKNN